MEIENILKSNCDITYDFELSYIAHKLHYTIAYGKIILLADEDCKTVNDLPVVRSKTIEIVKELESELFENWQQNQKHLNEPKYLMYPYYKFIYIDCAPEALDYASPGMPKKDCWVCPELLDKAKAKDQRERSKRARKLTYGQFIDRLYTCIYNKRLDEPAYAKKLLTRIALLENRKEDHKQIVLVFVNAHLLCERSGGKFSKYTSAGDMIVYIRDILEKTGTPILLLATDEIIDVLDADTNILYVK